MRPQETGFPAGIQERRNLLIAALTGQLWYPIPDNKTLGAGIGVDYGYTLMPSRHGHRFHKGIDLTARKGSDILAMYPGEISFSGELSRDYGLTVKVRHEIEVSDGLVLPFWTLVAHCSELMWDVGEVVEAEDHIAAAGNTGNCVRRDNDPDYGVHGHVEIRLLEDEPGAVTDPVPLLRNPMRGAKGPYWESDWVILRERAAPF